MASDNVNYIKKSDDLYWCKDCGHWNVRTALNAAFKRRKWDHTKIVVVTDIGCIGLIDRHFNTNAFHGLHGRSVTYATGLKLANPELHVVVLIGDGGCGIGSTHLVNAARRNIGITVLVCNNFNYGMTGCQHSVTTPTGGITKTSFHGNIESPLDVCALAQAGNASWVGRAINTEKDFEKFADLVHSALVHRGFSILDILERCPGGFGANNDIADEDEFNDYLLQFNYETGLLHIDEREEFSEIYRQRYFPMYEEAESNNTEPTQDRGMMNGGKRYLNQKFDSKLTEKVRIIVAASAGQSIITATTIFGAGAILSGLYSTQRNTYPITKRSGYSISETIISPEPIEYSGINVPDCLIILSKDGLNEVISRGWMGKMTADSMIILHKYLTNKLPENIRSRVVELFEGKYEEGNIKDREKVMPLISFTQLVEYTQWFPTDALSMAAEKMSPNYGDFIKTVIENTLQAMRNENLP